MDTALNKFLEVIKNASSRDVEKVPEDWHTRAEIAKLLDLSDSQTMAKIKRCRDAGLIEPRKFRIMTNRGVYPVEHYRLKS